MEERFQAYIWSHYIVGNGIPQRNQLAEERWKNSSYWEWPQTNCKHLHGIIGKQMPHGTYTDSWTLGNIQIKARYAYYCGLFICYGYNRVANISQVQYLAEEHLSTCRQTKTKFYQIPDIRYNVSCQARFGNNANRDEVNIWLVITYRINDTWTVCADQSDEIFLSCQGRRTKFGIRPIAQKVLANISLYNAIQAQPYRQTVGLQTGWQWWFTYSLLQPLRYPLLTNEMPTWD